MKRLNILCINWRDIKNPEAGGAEVYIHTISRIWVSQGHSVRFLSTRYKGCPSCEDVDGVHIIRKGDFRLFNATAFFYYKNLLEKESFDIVIDNISKVPLFCPLFIKKPLISIFYHGHGVTLFKELSFILALAVFFLESIAPLFYKRTKMITISESTKKELISLGMNSDLISVVHCGIDHNLYKPDLSKKEKSPLFIYLGRLKRYKMIENIIEAFSKVHDTYNSAKLFIAGKGDNLPALMQLSSKLGLEDAVEFLGFVSEDKKVELLQRAWAYVSSSIKEGWGISIIEAAACGTPAIAANVAGIRDAVKDRVTGILIPFGDIASMTEAMLEIIRRQNLRVKMSENALCWSRNFSWENTASLIFSRILDEIGLDKSPS